MSNRKEMATFVLRLISIIVVCVAGILTVGIAWGNLLGRIAVLEIRTANIEKRTEAINKNVDTLLRESRLTEFPTSY